LAKRNLFFEEKKESGINVFCFPYAGGGASVFYPWQGKFRGNINIYPAHYPGHEVRIAETPEKDIEKLVADIYRELQNRDFDKTPFYLFGHSLGTKIVYELAKLFKKNQNTNMRGVIVSAGRAPNRQEEHITYNLPEKEFFTELSRYNRTPEEVFENKTLWNIFEPALRADFCMAECYCDSSGEKLSVPMLALMGTKDPEMTELDLQEWKNYTTSKDFFHKIIEGEHLFIDTNRTQVIQEVEKFIYTEEEKYASKSGTGFTGNLQKRFSEAGIRNAG